MITAIRSLFVLSIMAMCWWAFIWPFVVSDDVANSIHHYGSIATLLVFFGCIVVLLAIQGYSRDEGKS